MYWTSYRNCKYSFRKNQAYTKQYNHETLSPNHRRRPTDRLRETNHNTFKCPVPLRHPAPDAWEESDQPGYRNRVSIPILRQRRRGLHLRRGIRGTVRVTVPLDEIGVMQYRDTRNNSNYREIALVAGDTSLVDYLPATRLWSQSYRSGPLPTPLACKSEALLAMAPGSK